MTVEQDLLLRCVRVALGSTDGQPICQRERGAIDWGMLLQTARRHGVLPLVLRAVTTCPEAVPTQVIRDLRARFLDNARRNLYLLGALRETLAMFEAQGVRAMPVKGPVLAARLHGDVALRQFSDLDILIPERDAARARALLLACGYTVTANPDERTAATAVRSRDGIPVVIDLQWAFAEPHWRFPLHVPGLWGRLERVAVGSAAVWQPAPADLILLLCSHPAKHCWSRLGWIADIAAFLRSEGARLDWTDALARARRSGGERLLLLGVNLAASLLGSGVPPEVRARIEADPAVVRLTRELRMRLFAAGGDPRNLNGSYGWVEAGLLYLRSRERRRDRVPHIVAMLQHVGRLVSFTPNAQDHAAVPLPARLRFLYYPIRPVRLLRKYGPHLRTVLRRDTLRDAVG